MIALLGAPAVIADGEPKALQISEKTLALLALLVCHSDRPLSRAWLASMLWPDVDEAEARTNLRRHFYKLTKALPPGADPLLLTKNSAQWNANAGYRCDVVDFFAAVERRDPEAALAAYGGPLCVGAFDDAVLEQRDRLQRTYVQLLREGIAAAGTARRLALLERLAAQDPLNEAWVRELAQERLNSGDRTGARRDLTALAARLRAELGVDPDEDTARMLMLCMETSETSASGNLPVEVNTLVGRESALDALTTLLRTERWITIAGPAGIGKTRLAIRTARTNREPFADGVWFVDLAAARTWQDALRRLAAVLSVSVESNDAALAVHAYLSSRRMLLVLDNLEQIDETAAAGIADLLHATPVAVLGTSRKRLGGTLERVYALERLALPNTSVTIADAMHYSAVRLFVDRAVAVSPAFTVSHENVAHLVSIVRRLDGLPLAIELVAARANLLTIEGIAKRVHDLDAFRHKDRDRRHQTVAAAIRWSYDLLSHREQLLLRRLATFEGAFDLAAAEHVCSDSELARQDVFLVLSELVEASFVMTAYHEQGVEQRYALLETVRQFLLGIAESDACVVDAHARYFAQRAYEAERAYDEIGTAEYVTRMRRDESNIDAALRHAWKTRNLRLVGTFVASLQRLWPSAEMKRHAHLFEFLATDGALAAQDAIFRARVYTALSAYASTLADWNWCLELRKQSAAFWREAGEESEALLADAMVAYAENYLGASLARDTVPALYAIVERLNAIGAAASYAARIEYNLASMELALGHVEKALQLALSAVAVMRREHRTNYIAACLTTLTRVYIQQNEFALAQRCVDESLALTEDPSYAVLRAQALGDGARIMLATNKPQEALRTYALALQTYERAFELRFVIRTLLGTLDALLDLGFAKRAAQISGYILGACAATGSVANAAIFEASSTYQRTREQAGDEFDGCARLGATFTYADVVKDVCAAASREDDFRTIASL